MTTPRTIKLLPEIFRTEPNQKFLNATLDQLVTEPVLKKLHGYIGRQFSPTFKRNDNYLTEPDARRQNFQLEPSVVIRDKSGNTTLYANYVDLLDQIKYSGGLTNNQTRLFDNEFYSFDGLIDFDKISDFNQYYWLTTGPDTVNVFAGGVDPDQVFDVIRDTRTNSYKFSGSADNKNPVVYLARGGTYTFRVNQPGRPFWVQSEGGVTGAKRTSRNISTRDVLGVENNGADVGDVTFTVPFTSAQEYYTNMTLLKPDVHIATYAHFNDMHGYLLSKIALSAFDNAYTTREQLQGKTLVFLNQDTDDETWTPRGTYDLSNYEMDFGRNPVYSGTLYDPGAVVPVDKRFNVWKIDFYFDTTTNAYTDVLVLVPAVNRVNLSDGLVIEEYIIPVEDPNGDAYKVFIKAGDTNVNKEFYKGYDGFLHEVPLITASLDKIYYQDGTDSSLVGYFKLVDQIDASIAVDEDILGALSYTSPNGVRFTNGLKINFDGNVTPEHYQNGEYYVERVGFGIRLVATSALVTPEDYDHSVMDYTVINRSSIDLNAWSRVNRWFHAGVIEATAKYNNVVPIYNNELRARRPIIEFDPDLALFNHGVVGTIPVNYLVNAVSWALPASLTNTAGQTDALSNVAQAEGVEVFAGTTLALDYATLYGRVVYDGDRIIFSDDVDPHVRNKIYQINFIDIDDIPAVVYKQVHLVLAEDSQLLQNHNVLVTAGPNFGRSYQFNGVSWTESQRKFTVNQIPLFDCFDNAGVSFSDTTAYVASNFVGTKIFGYKAATTGVIDEHLGIPLSYRNFNNVGDIEFSNYFDSDVVVYGVAPSMSTRSINSGVIHQTTSLTTSLPRNVWSTVVEKSKQYQNVTYTYDGTTNKFATTIEIANEKSIPYLKIYKNNVFLAENKDYVFTEAGIASFVTVTSTLVVGDRIDVLVYCGDSIATTGFYQVPLNLDYNAQNMIFTSLTLGQLRNHVTVLLQNGPTSVLSSVRDASIKSQGGNILQHSSPASHAALFLVDQDMNFPKSIEYAAGEYTKFKNKFMELCVILPDLDTSDPVAGVDTILSAINLVKSVEFPWHYTGMVPSNNGKITLEYTVFDPNNNEFEITSVFNPIGPSNTAVLVYLNGTQLLHRYDYVFNVEKAAVTVRAKLESDDIVSIVEYTNTDGCYVPETPTKLGLYPKYMPEIYLDSTYVTPISVLRGHDGSVTPIFNDYRDGFLLELERRIFNNIKVNTQRKILDLYDVMPGKFRKTDYSISEFSGILEQKFLSWAGANKVDYSTNTSFRSANPFTWNYGGLRDRQGEKLRGSWRAVYQYYYDTESPHLTPWEMLGFSEIPSWWVSYYGPAPYTGGNAVLWDDLESGYIVGGDTPGVDLRFRRPGLSKIIPVDDTGVLLSPQEIGLPASAVVDQGAASWQVGQYGPVEVAWRRSSDYAFAIQHVLSLTKPGRYFGGYVDIANYKHDAGLGQIVALDNQRIKQSGITFSGDTSSGRVVYSATYLNWIASRLVGLGVDPVVVIPEYLKNYKIQLSYKLSGFSDKGYLSVLAEQSSPASTNDSIVIPDENYEIFLNKSTPINSLAYSAVIIGKTARGYSIQGYDTDSPYFKVCETAPGARSVSIKVLDNTASISTNFLETAVILPYGYEFTTKQAVVDFLMGYQHYLRSQSFTFVDVDPVLGEIKDWQLSAKEFLFWSIQAWQAGNVLVVSPAGSRLSLQSAGAVVDAIEDSSSGTKILDQNFNIIKQNEYSVIRDNETFAVILPDNKIVCLAKLTLVQYEHALIFDNVTVFNDVIYKPELGNRQFRLKLVGQKTDNWNGRLSPPGFVYSRSTTDEWRPGVDYLKGTLVVHKNIFYSALQIVIAADVFDTSKWKVIPKDQIKTGLLPNFANNAGKSKNYYDVDSTLVDTATNQYSKGVLGFRTRAYLDELSLSEQTQIKFFQGFIRDKGTKNAITALTNTKFNNITGDINYYEEWAVRTGSYGALETNQFIEVVLDAANVVTNPTTVQFSGETISSEIPGILRFDTASAYKTSNRYAGNIALSRGRVSNFSDDILTAGFVRGDEVDTTIFDLNNYETLSSNTAIMSNIGSGFTVWTAKDLKQNWNVFRISETDNSVVRVENGIGEFLTFYTLVDHDLLIDDVVVVKGFDVLYDGFYKVLDSSDSKSFVISFNGNTTGLTSLSGSGLLFKLVSLRFEYPTDLASFVPRHNWKEGEQVWVDTASISGWGVYKKLTPWLAPIDPLVAHVGSPDDKFGHSATLSSDSKFLVVGEPGDNTLRVFNRTGNSDAFMSGSVITVINAAGLGKSLAQGNLFIAAGAPDSDNGLGNVYIYRRTTGNLTLSQVITGGSMAGAAIGDEFGYSVSISSDDRWLYIGAPGANAATGAVHTFRMYANSYVQHVDGTILASATGSTAGFRFGTSVKTNTTGDIIVVGAPQPGRTLSENIGAAYVFDRAVEAFVGTGNNFITTTTGNLTSNSQITINGAVITSPGKYTLTGNSLVFFANSIPAVGSLILAETDVLKLVTVLRPSDAQILSEFGTCVDISKTTQNIYVGAPRGDGAEYDSGAVYGYIDQGKRYGNVVGSVTNPTITNSHSIRVDDFIVTFNGTTVTSANTVINSANIVGVTSFVTDDNRLCIVSNKSKETRPLKLAPGVGSAFADLGLGNVFVQTQRISPPTELANDKFGQRVKVCDNSTTLLISSKDATAFAPMTFDDGGTYFDQYTTAFLDRVNDSGAVFVFDLIESAQSSIRAADKFVFSQQLQVADMHAGDNFGSAIETSGNLVVVGSSETVESGKAFVFNNATGEAGWQLVKTQGEQVDHDSVNNIFLFNKKTRELTDVLDWIDPVKGKILGQAEQELDYKTTFDPAFYNRGLTANTTDEFHWNETQVGDTWWDLSSVRYIDYEQDSLLYRASVWGQLFNGSEIRVYEWVESITPPSKYLGPGAPRDSVGGGYVELTKVDQVTGVIRSMYYFWVYAKDSVNARAGGRKLPITVIQDMIENPQGQGVPYAAILQRDAVALFNVRSRLTSDNIVLHVDYDETKNSNIIHSEYELLPEGANVSIPTSLANKLTDSLSGIDRLGNIVPDPLLKETDRYGIELRPRQTMFVDRNAATKEMVEYVNTVCSENRIALECDLTRLMYEEKHPPAGVTSSVAYVTMGNVGLGYNSTTVAVSFSTPGGFGGTVAVGVANVTQLGAIDYITITEPGFGYSAAPTITITGGNTYVATATTSITHYVLAVPVLEELDYLTTSVLPDNYRVLVKTDTAGRWGIYKWNLSTWVRTRQQSVKTSEFWKYIDWYQTGYSVSTPVTYAVSTFTEYLKLTLVPGDVIRVANAGDGNFELLLVNSDLSTTNIGAGSGTIELLPTLYGPVLSHGNEMRNIVDALHRDILIDRLLPAFNNMFFLLVNYMLTEQTELNWIFKTSFISIIHKLRKLDQYSNFVKDNQDFYLEYINETKPYKTKVREYLIDYEGNDHFHGGVTDFDLPAYYDTVAGKFRSPSGESVTDEAIVTSAPYNEWNNNHAHSIDSISIESAGTGFIYPETPDVMIMGGGGSGAAARAIVNYGTGKVEAIEMISNGSGYTSSATVTINGTGVNARAYANLANKKTRKMLTTMKFDRIGYTHSISQWQPSTRYYAGNANVISYYDSMTNTRAAYVVNSNTSVLTGTLFNPDQFQNIAMVPPWRANVAYTANTIVSYRTPTESVILNSTNVAFYRANSSIVSSNIANVNFNDLWLKHGSTIEIDYSDTVRTPNKGFFTVDTISSSTIVVLDTTSVNNTTTGAPVLVSLIDAAAGPSVLIKSNIIPYVLSNDIAFFQANGSIFSNNTANVNFLTFHIGYGSTVEVDYAPGVLDTPNKGKFTANVVTANTVTILGQIGIKQLNMLQDADAGPMIVLSSVKPAINLANVYFVNNNFTSTTAFDSLNMTRIGNATADFSNANDRIMALYQPTRTMVPRDPRRLVSGIDYAGIIVDGTKFELNVQSISSNVISFTPHPNGFVSTVITIDNPGYGYRPGDAAVVFEANNGFPGATARGDVRLFPNGAVSSISLTFPGQGYTYSPRITLTGANTSAASATSYLAGTLQSSNVTYGNLANLHVSDFTSSNLDSIMVINSPKNSGLYVVETIANSTYFNVGRSAIINSESQGNVVTLYSWKHADARADVDSVIEGFFSNINLGTTTGDLNTTGGQFVDNTNSYAPEELVSGSVYDHLNISVFTNAAVSTGHVGYRVVENMRGVRTYSRIADSSTTTLASDLLIGDSVIHVVDVSKLPFPQDTLGVPGVVFINGERITYYDIDTHGNLLKRIRRATEGTGGAAVHISGSRVVDASANQTFIGSNERVNWEWYNGKIVSNAIAFFSGNNTIYSTDPVAANLILHAGNAIVITGSKVNSGIGNIVVATATSGALVISSPTVLVNELAGNIITLSFYSNTNANILSSGTVSSIFMSAEPCFVP